MLAGIFCRNVFHEFLDWEKLNILFGGWVMLNTNIFKLANNQNIVNSTLCPSESPWCRMGTVVWAFSTISHLWAGLPVQTTSPMMHYCLLSGLSTMVPTLRGDSPKTVSISAATQRMGGATCMLCLNTSLKSSIVFQTSQ